MRDPLVRVFRWGTRHKSEFFNGEEETDQITSASISAHSCLQGFVVFVLLISLPSPLFRLSLRLPLQHNVPALTPFHPHQGPVQLAPLAARTVKADLQRSEQVGLIGLIRPAEPGSDRSPPAHRRHSSGSWDLASWSAVAGCTARHRCRGRTCKGLTDSGCRSGFGDSAPVLASPPCLSPSIDHDHRSVPVPDLDLFLS